MAETIKKTNKETSQKETTLGVLGGGQLGKFFVMAARASGRRTAVFDQQPDSLAGKEADIFIQANYDDKNALNEFARQCDAATIEFENIPTEALLFLTDKLVLHPSPLALKTANNRATEKNFLRNAGFATVNFAAVANIEEAKRKFAELSPPLIMKTACGGYDGKGQIVITTPKQTSEAFLKLGSHPCIIEEKIPLRQELSVIAARNTQGQSFSYPVAANEHRDGILHKSVVPAPIPQELSSQAQSLAEKLLQSLDYCGVLGVEFFVSENDKLLVNEFAPRAHNSGHYTIDACDISQFQQQALILGGQEIGQAKMTRQAAVMVNLLGDLWRRGPPDLRFLEKQNDLKLHIYGKSEARPGRKMGHFCLLGNNHEQLSELADQLFQKLDKRAMGDAAS